MARGEHFQGLSIAARALAKRGEISQKMYKKLVVIDQAFGLVRHITEASAEDFYRDFSHFLRSNCAGRVLVSGSEPELGPTTATGDADGANLSVCELAAADDFIEGRGWGTKPETMIHELDEARDCTGPVQSVSVSVHQVFRFGDEAFEEVVQDIPLLDHGDSQKEQEPEQEHREPLVYDKPVVLTGSGMVAYLRRQRLENMKYAVKIAPWHMKCACEGDIGRLDLGEDDFEVLEPRITPHGRKQFRFVEERLKCGGGMSKKLLKHTLEVLERQVMENT